MDIVFGMNEGQDSARPAERAPIELAACAYEAVMAWGRALLDGPQITPIHNPEKAERSAGHIAGLIASLHHLADVIAPDAEWADVWTEAEMIYRDRGKTGR